MALARTLARRRVYYGWYIIGVAFAAAGLGAAISTDAPGIFIRPMTQELHWGRGFYTAVVYSNTLAAIPLAMLLWPLVDRRGAQGVMIVCGLIMGAGTAALGLVREPWHFILLKSLIIPIGVVGSGPVVSQLVASNWFIKRRGRALAITAMGLSFSGLATPPLAAFLISALGWRQAWLVLGLMVAGLLVPLGALFMRRRPEDLGLLPDGEAAAARGQAEASPPQPEVIWSRRDVLSTPSFWLLALAFPVGSLAFGLIKQHTFAFLTDPEMGYSSQTAALFLTFWSLFSFGAKIPWGLIMERVSPIHCGVVSYLLFSVGLFLLVLGGSNPPVLFLAAGIIGIGWAPTSQLGAFLWANYYGRSSQGLARSLSTPSQAMSGLLGPVLAGFLWDITGSYKGIFKVYAGTPVLAALLIGLLRPPKKPAPALKI